MSNQQRNREEVGLPIVTVDEALEELIVQGERISDSEDEKRKKYDAFEFFADIAAVISCSAALGAGGAAIYGLGFCLAAGLSFIPGVAATLAIIFVGALAFVACMGIGAFFKGLIDRHHKRKAKKQSNNRCVAGQEERPTVERERTASILVARGPLLVVAETAAGGVQPSCAVTRADAAAVRRDNTSLASGSHDTSVLVAARRSSRSASFFQANVPQTIAYV